MKIYNINSHYLKLILILAICALVLHCTSKSQHKPEPGTKYQRLGTLGNLLKIHLSIKPPGFKPELPNPIIILKKFEPIPHDDPDKSRKVIAFLPAVNHWRNGESKRVIQTINSLHIEEDTAFRFLMDAYIKLDNSKKAIEFGNKITEKDNQIYVALGICALRAKIYDQAPDFFKALEMDTIWQKFAAEQTGNAYFMKADSFQNGSTLSHRNFYLNKAIEHWEKVERFEKFFPRAQYSLGVAHYLLENYEKARQYFYQIYNKREDELLARLYILLSYRNQVDEKSQELESFLKKMYIDSKYHNEDAKNLLKTVVLSWYFLGEDQYELGNHEKAREYWRNAREALYKYNFPGNDKLEFLYIRAVIYQLIQETGDEPYSAEKNATLFTFKELYDSLKTYSEWKPELDHFAGKTGDILFVLNEKNLSYEFYKLLRSPDEITFSNLLATHPKHEHSITTKSLYEIEASPYSFFVILSIYSAILLKTQRYEESPQILDNLIEMRKFARPDDQKICTVLLIQFCDSLSVGSTRYYETELARLETKKTELYEAGKDLTSIDFQLQKMAEARDTVSRKITRVLLELEDLSKDDSNIPNYIFISPDTLRKNITGIIIFPDMSFSSHKTNENEE